MFKHILYLFSAAALLLSCEKNSLQLPIDPVTSGARLKLVHAAPDLSSLDLLIGGKKFSGFTPVGATATSPGRPTGIPYNTTFPAAGSNYAIVTPGAQSISLSVPASTTASSATVITTQNLTLEDNKYYSLLVAGAGVQPEVMLVNDVFDGAEEVTKLYVRFINLVPGSTYDLALNNPNTVLASNLAYKAVSPYTAVDAITGPVFAFRAPGSATNLGTVTFTSSSAGRAITVFIRGIQGRTGTAAPGLNVYVNR
ncbi:DUF4397 domain-containing protein [Fibrella aquatica]|jgi:Domain of unknown function (DUF4397)|uniref:DUF4397 domain-containing protein n=1 Tax=Fibrella aquatica TaxID=3242487 RepID=UPI0035209764